MIIIASLYLILGRSVITVFRGFLHVGLRGLRGGPQMIMRWLWLWLRLVLIIGIAPLLVLLVLILIMAIVAAFLVNGGLLEELLCPGVVQ